MNRIRIFVAVLFVWVVAASAQAEDYGYDCNTCDTTATASLYGELKGHGYSDGYHTVFVANMSLPTVWQVDIHVTTGPPDPLIGIGTTSVVVLSVTNSPPEVDAALQTWKDIGITGLFFEPVVDWAIDLTGNTEVASFCPTAGAGTCSVVSNALYALPVTQVYVQASTVVMTTMSRLWARMTYQVWFPLRFLVTFPDGSFEIYEFQSVGSGGSVQAVANTAIDTSGNAISPGGGAPASLAGWGVYYGGSNYNSSGTVAYATGGGASTDCEEWVFITTDGSGAVISVELRRVCD